jgi:hypothetical protein
MPPEQQDAWISSENLKLPLQELEASEIADYLAWQFGDLAKKSEPLHLRETASVVRYLHWLALHGVPKEVIHAGAEAVEEYRRTGRTKDALQSRQAVERTAKIIWGDLLQFGQIEAASKSETENFLREHAPYWPHPWMELSLKFLEDYDLPPDARSPFRPPHLHGRDASAQGDGNPYVQSDLSERIAAADRVLARARVRGRRKQIAEVLNASPLTRRSDALWGPEEVADRVKGYKKQKRDIRYEALANGLADRWIASYRYDRWVTKQRHDSFRDESLGKAEKITRD